MCAVNNANTFASIVNTFWSCHTYECVSCNRAVTMQKYVVVRKANTLHIHTTLRLTNSAYGSLRGSFQGQTHCGRTLVFLSIRI